MEEPDGLLDRLREGRPTALDLAYVAHRLSQTRNATEAKLLRNLQARYIPGRPIEGR